MDLLSKDEPLINLNGFDSPEDLLSDESLQPHHQRRLNPSKHANTSSSRQPRLSSGSKATLSLSLSVRVCVYVKRDTQSFVKLEVFKFLCSKPQYGVFSFVMLLIALGFHHKSARFNSTNRFQLIQYNRHIGGCMR